MTTFDCRYTLADEPFGLLERIIEISYSPCTMTDDDLARACIKEIAMWELVPVENVRLYRWERLK